MKNIPWVDWIQVALFFIVIIFTIKPLGNYMARVYSGRFILLEPILGPIEDTFYKLMGIDPEREMNWREYCSAVMLSSVAGFLFLFCILRFQSFFPMNPQQFPDLETDLAFNTAISFVTNTNWQAYAGESTLSYFSQMLGLTVQNFLSASMGMAVAVAFIRGLSRKGSNHIGNYWVDWTRGCLYILLPLSLLLSLALGSQGVIQNFKPYVLATTLEQNYQDHNGLMQLIPGGPAASQVAIKLIGTNGGGFFNTNSATPYENPTPVSNFLQLLAMLIIPIAFCYTFGVMINDKRQGWALIVAMTLIFIPLFLFGFYQEQKGNFLLDPYRVDRHASHLQSGGNMEGKEVRFGIINSALWASVTTSTSSGAVNSMHDSYMPLGGMVLLVFLCLGEVIYGGVGAGLYGMLIFVILTVFLAGLMVGRTPEYLGKKIQSFEIKMASIALLLPSLVLLVGAAMAVCVQAGLEGMHNPGSQGFSEILYAFASTSGNNGSAFAGLKAGSAFYNYILGVTMLVGRYGIIIPLLAMAGALAKKNTMSSTSGTMSTHTLLFILLLTGVKMVGLLTFVPAITLAPVAEYFSMDKLK